MNLGSSVTSNQTIFICYRRDDSLDIVGRINLWLEIRLPPQMVFFDLRSIPIGANFRDMVLKSIQEAGIVLVVIGKHWLTISDSDGTRKIDNEEDVLRIEIQTALDNGKSIIPVLVQNALMPKAKELPQSIRMLSDLQAISIRPDPDFDVDMRRLREAIIKIMPIPFKPPEYPSSAPYGDQIDPLEIPPSAYPIDPLLMPVPVMPVPAKRQEFILGFDGELILVGVDQEKKKFLGERTPLDQEEEEPPSPPLQENKVSWIRKLFHKKRN